MTHETFVRWASALGLTLGVWLLGWIASRFALRALARALRKTPTDLDDLLLDAVRPHLAFWFLALGVTVGARYGGPGDAAVALVDKFALAAVLLSVTLAAATFAADVAARHSARWSSPLASTTLTRNAVKIVVVCLGGLVVLGNLGIAIAPILTALGVGSLAVALALQPTLSNLFAGIHIALAHRIRVGDYVELETGQQGYVADIGWRSTQIRELSNNLVIVPNARISEIIVRNYSLPEDEQAALVQVGVAYGSDLTEVERVTIATAREVQKSVQGAVTTFEPFIRYNAFGDSAIDFTVILRVKGFVDRYLVVHEFMKRLHVRYAEAGIEIPFPQRVVTFANPEALARP